ncbi:MAG: membrane protein insertion efficiency factor YidD [Acidobacteriota bacterium]|nr:membrane protein insertion efficiency factor YidD [Acidobacteriota bacterium]
MRRGLQAGLQNGLQGILRAYQRWISPSLPPTCRYTPTCSQYAIEALEQRGLLVGTALAAWRVLRCHPFVKGGSDPVPVPASHYPAPNPSPTPAPGADRMKR